VWKAKRLDEALNDTIGGDRIKFEGDDSLSSAYGIAALSLGRRLVTSEVASRSCRRVSPNVHFEEGGVHYPSRREG
jgi:hypothetical protein